MRLNNIDILKTQEGNYELELLSNKDELTNLYNHSYFYEYLREKTLNTKKISVIFLDIDRFKIINDKLGYRIGDIVLKIIGRLIKEKLLDNMKAFRYGGEEFSIVVEDMNSNDTLFLAEDIRKIIERSPLLLNISLNIPITVSAGIANYPTDHNEIGEVVKLAENAMYYSKQNGRNKCILYSADAVQKTNHDLDKKLKRDATFQAVKLLVCALEAKDSYTKKHSEMVKDYSLMIADNMQLSEINKEMLEISSILHDCGKIGIPDSILNKVSKLTSKEYEVIKTHSKIGYNIVSNFIEDDVIKACIRSHHERWDGMGYPDGLIGNKIPLLARIIAVADSYEAMTSDRPYRNSLSKETAIIELKNCKGSQFDPRIVDAFINELKKDKHFKVKNLKNEDREVVRGTLQIKSKMDREVLRKAYEGTKNYILMIDPTYKIIYTNSKINKLISKNEEEVVGQKCYKTFLGTDEPCKNCKVMDVINKKEIQEKTKHEVTIDGKEQWIKQIWIPIFGAHGDVESIIEIAIPLNN